MVSFDVAQASAGVRSPRRKHRVKPVRQKNRAERIDHKPSAIRVKPKVTKSKTSDDNKATPDAAPDRLIATLDDVNREPEEILARARGEK